MPEPATPGLDVFDHAFFAHTASEVAPRLIGATLKVDGVGGAIVEVEAYDQADPASHSFGGMTPRNASMFGPPGCAYVYRSYGIHWCLNVVCNEAGHAGGVLIRAVQPLYGLEIMAERRGTTEPRQLCSGPGKLCQALGVSRAYDGLPLDRPPFSLQPSTGMAEVAVGPRIGISKGVETPWRFGLAGSPFLSRPFSTARGDRALSSPKSLR